MVQRFLNDVVKPWEDLNADLARPIAVQPDLSNFTRLASGLAVSTKHQVDHRHLTRAAVDAASAENALMSDVADAAKHGGLCDPNRNNSLSVTSNFEYDAARGFQFIRNAISINHASLGDRDFMQTALAAIRFWMGQLGFSLNRALAIAEGPNEFFDAARLYFDPQHCIQMDKCQIGFFERGKNGEHRPVEPPEVKFVVLDTPPGTSEPRITGAK